MAFEHLNPQDKIICDRLTRHLKNEQHVSKKSIKYFESIKSDISLQPSMHYETSRKITVVIEISQDNPYSDLIQSAVSDMLNSTQPATIYSVCSKEAYISHTKEVKRLQEEGHGLYTFDADGNIELKFKGTPVIFHISEKQFKTKIKPLSPKLKTSLQTSYDIYKSEPSTGVHEVSEVIEAIINSIIEQVISKKWCKDKKNLKIKTCLKA